MRLTGKVALITGAANGIGRASAGLFAREGAHVIASDLDASALAPVCREIEAAGGAVRAIPCDVAQEAQVAALFRDIREREGRLDILYTNAGISGAIGGIAAQTREDWERVFRVNVDGTWLCCREAVALMPESGGAIVTQASIAALMGGGPPGAGPVAGYTAAKAAVVGLTRAIAYEYGHRNIRCNAVLPGSIETAMTQPLMSSRTYVEGVTRATPLARFGKPEEVAAAALFLASDEASFVSGETLVVDGGFIVAQGPVYPQAAL
ncbi:SDR family NAD(P)-dependent oxidoreductase [Stappia sp.]|uniref:SDR family NAD(P)-dependent oxidoreductase n=1 Tax=Stappia sp. TaxID=1870903 RepID=UPI0032D92969